MDVKFYDVEADCSVTFEDVEYFDIYPDGVDLFFRSGQNIFLSTSKYKLIFAGE